MANVITEEAMEERRSEVRKEEERLIEELTKVRRELQAIDLYLKALHGELPPETRTNLRAVTRTRGEGPRSRTGRGEQRAKLLALLGEGHRDLPGPS